jgi:imidazolonepropionase-like amidohydrolase
MTSTGVVKLVMGVLAASLASNGASRADGPPRSDKDLVIVNATLMTVSHGTIPHGSIWIHDGKIAGVGPSVPAPPDARIIDAAGRFVTPGIVEAHAHVGMGGQYDPQDTNEYQGKLWGRMAGPIQADLHIRDSIKTDDYAFYVLLASGQTTDLELPGSANLFGGQAAPIKLKVGRPREEMFINGAPRSFKIACGDTPVRVWKGRGVGFEKPSDIAAARRRAYDATLAYLAKKAAYQKAIAAGDHTAVPPPINLKLEAIAHILRDGALLQMHCHKADSILEELAVARDYGYTLHTIHHGSEAYKIAPQIAASGAGVLAMADMWGGSNQTVDGIPWNVPIDKAAGVKVALHGEVFSVSRRLSQEAGKMLRYGKGQFTRDEALALVTLNAAWVFGLDDRIGSLDVGKDGDVVIWDGDPLSTYGHAAEVFIEGEPYFDETLPGLGLVQHDQGRAQ